MARPSPRTPPIRLWVRLVRFEAPLTEAEKICQGWRLKDEGNSPLMEAKDAAEGSKLYAKALALVGKSGNYGKDKELKADSDELRSSSQQPRPVQ